MEISLNDLKELLASTGATTGDAPDHPLIGKTVLVRTRVSGVSIGTLKSVSCAGGMITVVLGDVDGVSPVRVHSWEGNAFTCSEVARDGCKGHLAIHPEGMFTTTEQGAEILPVTEKAWTRIMNESHFGALS